MIIKRDLLEKIEPFLLRKEFLAIIGPRQCGKTTFLEILKEHLISYQYVDKELIHIITFENRKLLMEFDRDPVEFIQSYIPHNSNAQCYVMIDEFQYADEGGQKLKLIYDTVKRIKIIISGSSSLDLRAKVGKYMVGRMLNFNLFPFNYNEFLRAKDQRLENIYSPKNIDVRNWIFNGMEFKPKTGIDQFHDEMIKQYEEYCIWGGYPAVILTRSHPERAKVLSDIYSSYILKDIKTLLELATEKHLYLLSQYLAAQIGNITVYQNLTQVAGLDYRKLKEHLSILMETFITSEVKPFFKNKQKELSKNPKIYFLDTGFRNSLIENMNSLPLRTDAGALVENSIFIRLNELCTGFNKINYWRSKAGAEVDFILHTNNGIVPIEIKYSAFTTQKYTRGFLNFLLSFKPKRALIATKNYWGYDKKDSIEILFVPLYYL